MERQWALNRCDIRQVGDLVKELLVIRRDVHLDRAILRLSDLAIRAPPELGRGLLVAGVVVLPDRGPELLLEAGGVGVVEDLALPIDQEEGESAGDASGECYAGLAHESHAGFARIILCGTRCGLD